MWKMACPCLLLALLLFPLQGRCEKSDLESLYSSGSIDEKGLDYQNFELMPDGFVKGQIVNHSKGVYKALQVDMWTTNMSDTRIYWRKTINIGDLAPEAKFDVKEAHDKDVDPNLIKFMFRIHGTR
jgi:hypothetical protein